MNIEKKLLGTMEEWSLSNDNNDDLVRIIPSAGGMIWFVRLKGRTVISGPETEAGLHQDEHYQSALLFPWGGRIKDGAYTFRGVSYQLPINEASLNNALHGYVYNRPFVVAETTAEENHCQLHMRYAGDGTYKGYPFPFVLEVKVTLFSNSELTIGFKVENTGRTAMPYVLGWHPYLRFDSEQAGEWEVRFPAKLKYKLDKFNIPASLEEIECPENYAISVGDKNLNELFLLVPTTKGVVTTELFSTVTGQRIQLWQTAGKNQFKYLVIYTPPHRRSIAVEPMSGCVDAFNNHDGLISLSPNEKIESCIGLNVKLEATEAGGPYDLSDASKKA